MFLCWLKVLVSLVNIVEPKQEEHPVRQFCQYRLRSRGGEGRVAAGVQSSPGYWSKIAENCYLELNYDQVGQQEEAGVLSE